MCYLVIEYDENKIEGLEFENVSECYNWYMKNSINYDNITKVAVLYEKESA